ncbi:TetR/AcrR family transcriptional regulator [Rhodococcus sp. PAMC28707]|uniref:ScbR family autoregulator-binding transcription factor n=1 Tax=unclassified Rhodococcus (in: high G+C Gram-positive bacteria) TaxID=192944 RepID=UPI00109DA64F|nr:MULTISPECIES: ScbR family autoregulator-binding transcription factor [unclassified Rhodococcus (in: high G+C Gram-positive bacteria)]QCB51188.1 TetR/AcrR family transcriptional regulator [Rhodococcus sp. PAMC28705]QCB61251.1 TetR/AcrR family transcriptional regulator [Rhodococcus sp. PAMC28707]
MQERAVLTRQAAILGAAKSFEKFGYSASLGTILQHAGVSKGAMYFHFASKEELAHAVIEAQHAMAMEGTRLVGTQSDTAVEMLVLVSQEMARQLVTEPIARGGMRLTMEIGSIQGPIEKPYLDWIDAIKEIALQAAEDGDIVKGTDIDALARFIVGSFTGVQILSEMLTGRTDLYERLNQMWNLVLPTIVHKSTLAHVMRLAGLPPRKSEAATA